MHRHQPQPRSSGGTAVARGFGRFGGWFVEDGELGGPRVRMGRKLASADLQLLILGLLADKPRHGYEIIKALDERSKGFYAPSPGMVYPALTHLEEIGHATVEAEGTRKLYHITDLGRRTWRNTKPPPMPCWLSSNAVGERMDSLRRALQAGEGDEPAPPAGATGRGR